MKAVIQRVKNASCKVDNEITGSIDDGLLIYFFAENGDEESMLEPFISKILRLRIFEDENGKMNKSLKDISGKVLFISQFTLAASIRRGNRPSFDGALEREKAEELYRKAIDLIKSHDIEVGVGMFGAHMEIEYMNDGPVTIIADSKELGLH